MPDDILRAVKQNGGVIMVNFYSGFIVPEAGRKMRAVLQEMRAKYPDRAERAKAMDAWRKSDEARFARGTYRDVADHIDHIVKVAGVDHVGIGSDFDGISQSPVGLEDVSCYPRLTDELLRRGYSEADVHKILGGNVLRAFRQAGQVAKRLRATTRPEVEDIKPEPRGTDLNAGSITASSGTRSGPSARLRRGHRRRCARRCPCRSGRCRR